MAILKIWAFGTSSNYAQGLILNSNLGDAAPKFIAALGQVIDMVPQPTLLAIPDMNAMNKASYAQILAKMLSVAAPGDPNSGSTGAQLAVVDVFGGALVNSGNYQALVTQFRNLCPNGPSLSYGAAYFPYIVSLVGVPIWYNNLAQGWDLIIGGNPSDPCDPKSTNASNALLSDRILAAYKCPLANDAANPTGVDTLTLTQIQQTLVATYPTYEAWSVMIGTAMNTIPSAGAVLGKFNDVDNICGVWTAPANVGLASVVGPTFTMSDTQQGFLNVDPLSGKSIDPIRSFVGQGTLIFGGRTLDGNSQDYRYVNVRRTLLNIEQSAKAALRPYIFQPNTPATWNLIHASLSSMLTQLWTQGGLVGRTAESAFSVQIGIPATMTAQDVLNGIMNLTISVAISHPAEFIHLTVTQQLQS